MPPYGDWPERFPATVRGREGFVVRFVPDRQPAWVGNSFGDMSAFDHVCDYPNGRDVVAVAGGETFDVDPLARGLGVSFGGPIA